MNTDTASFSITVRQLTEMYQWPKMSQQDKETSWDKNISGKQRWWKNDAIVFLVHPMTDHLPVNLHTTC